MSVQIDRPAIKIYVRKGEDGTGRRLSFRRFDLPFQVLLDAGFAIDGNQAMCDAPADAKGLRERELWLMDFITSRGYAVDFE